MKKPSLEPFAFEWDTVDGTKMHAIVAKSREDPETFDVYLPVEHGMTFMKGEMHAFQREDEFLLSEEVVKPGVSTAVTPSKSLFMRHVTFACFVEHAHHHEPAFREWALQILERCPAWPHRLHPRLLETFDKLVARKESFADVAMSQLDAHIQAYFVANRGLLESNYVRAHRKYWRREAIEQLRDDRKRKIRKCVLENMME